MYMYAIEKYMLTQFSIPNHIHYLCAILVQFFVQCNIPCIQFCNSPAAQADDNKTVFKEWSQPRFFMERLALSETTKKTQPIDDAQISKNARTQKYKKPHVNCTDREVVQSELQCNCVLCLGCFVLHCRVAALSWPGTTLVFRHLIAKTIE